MKGDWHQVASEILIVPNNDKHSSILLYGTKILKNNAGTMLFI
jgi:hypothetical protein